MIEPILELIIEVISILITFTAGIIELRLNPKNWLNRWFAIFFFSFSLGFLAFMIYHLIICPGCEPIVISIMILAQIFFNLIPISLVMTVFILEKSQDVAVNPKYLGLMISILILISFGYFIWSPDLDLDSYVIGVVNTRTPGIWLAFVNIGRMGLLAYVIYRYAIITQKTEVQTKRRIQWFFVGISIVAIGLIVNLIGGIIDLIPIESVALIIINIGVILIVKGFFI